MTYCSNCDNTVDGAVIEVNDFGFCTKCKKKVDVTRSTEAAAALAESHWQYVASTIFAHTGTALEDRDYIICKHHYITAFAHGFKHGVDSTKLGVH